MSKDTIEIQVEPDAARAYAETTDDQRRKLNLLLSIRIEEATRPDSALETLMCDIARRARERGLTEEKLVELLEDE